MRPITEERLRMVRPEFRRLLIDRDGVKGVAKYLGVTSSCISVSITRGGLSRRQAARAELLSGGYYKASLLTKQ